MDVPGSLPGRPKYDIIEKLLLVKIPLFEPIKEKSPKTGELRFDKPVLFELCIAKLLVVNFINRSLALKIFEIFVIKVPKID